MAVLTRIPEIGYSTLYVDVRDTLNAYGGRVGNIYDTPFAGSANINVWSRRKPHVNTRNPQPLVMTTEEMAETLNSSGVVIRRYGIQILGGAMTPAELYSQILGDLGYIYPLPTGGALQPFRLQDFNGYYPEAVLPLRTTFSDGYQFDYLEYEYPLTGIELPNKGNEGQLYREDLYPTKDENGNPITLRRGVYIRSEDGSVTATAIGTLKIGNGTQLGAVNASRLAGKNFNIMEFLTNAPEGWVGIDEDFVRSGYFCYALPLPISHCSMASSSGGVVPTIKTAFVDFDSFPTFFVKVAGDYSKVFAKFRLSSMGSLYSGGDITDFACGIYRDYACTDIIERQKFDDLYLNPEATSPFKTVILSNTTGSAGIYFGVWFNGALQYRGNIKMQVTTIAEE